MADPVALDLDALGRHLAEHAPTLAPPAAATMIQGGRSNLTYLLTDAQGGRWVLRRPPLGEIAATANDLGREHRVVTAMWEAGVPVAEPVLWCDDPTVIGAPFNLMAFVDGPVVRTAADGRALPPAAAVAAADALVDALALLHAVDVDRPGVRELGRPDGFVDRQIRRWWQQWEAVRTRHVPGIEELWEALATRRPPRSARSVVHGDYRVDNTIFAPGDTSRIAAVVDWEMATLGDPLTDLGLLLVYWDEVVAPILPDGHPIAANPAFPSPDALVERYVAATGAVVDDLPFYRALAAFKLAVIAEGIHRRFTQGLVVGDGFETVGDAVAALVDHGRDALLARR